MKTSVILTFLLCWSFVSSNPNQAKSNDKSVSEVNYKNDRGSVNSSLANEDSSNTSNRDEWGGDNFNLLRHKDPDDVDENERTNNKLHPVLLFSKGLKMTKEFLWNIKKMIETLISKNKSFDNLSNGTDLPNDDVNGNILSWILKAVKSIFNSQDRNNTTSNPKIEKSTSTDEEAENRGKRAIRDLGISGVQIGSPYRGSISEHLIKLSEGSTNNVLRPEKATIAEALNGRAAIRKILARARAKAAKAVKHKSYYNNDDFSKWLVSGSSFDTNIFKHPIHRPSFDNTKSTEDSKTTANTDDSHRHSFSISRHASESTKHPHREAKRTFNALSDTTTVDTANNKYPFTSLQQKSRYQERPSSKLQVTSGNKNEMLREPALPHRILLPRKDIENNVPKWIHRHRFRSRKRHYMPSFEFEPVEEEEKHDRKFIFRRTFDRLEDEQTNEGQVRSTRRKAYENSPEMNIPEKIHHDRVLDDEKAANSRGRKKPGRKRYYYRAGNREGSVHNEADSTAFDDTKNGRLTTGFLVEHIPPVNPRQEENIRKKAKHDHDGVQWSAIYSASSTETTEGVEKKQLRNMLIKKISTDTPTWKVENNDIESYHSRDQNAAANAATSFSSSLSDTNGNKHTNNVLASPSVDDGSAATKSRAENNNGVLEWTQSVIDNDATEIEMGLDGIKSQQHVDLSSVHSSRFRPRSETHSTSQENHRDINEYQQATVDVAASKTEHSIKGKEESEQNLKRAKSQKISDPGGRKDYENREGKENQEIMHDATLSEKTTKVKSAREYDLLRGFSPDDPRKKNFEQGEQRHRTSIEIIDIDDRDGKAYVFTSGFPVRKFRKGHTSRDTDYYNFDDEEMYDDRFAETDESVENLETNDTDYNDLTEENEQRDEYQYNLSRQAFYEYVRNMMLTTTTTMNRTEFEEWIKYLYFIWQQEVEESDVPFEISTSATGKNKKQTGAMDEEISSRRLGEKHTEDEDNYIHLRKHEEQPSHARKLIIKNTPGSAQSTHSIETHEITSTEGHEVGKTKSEAGANNRSENHKTVETRTETLNCDSSATDTASGVSSGRKTINNNSHQQGSQNLSGNSSVDAQTKTERAYDAHRRNEDVDINKSAETTQSNAEISVEAKNTLQNKQKEMVSLISKSSAISEIELKNSSRDIQTEKRNINNSGTSSGIISNNIQNKFSISSSKLSIKPEIKTNSILHKNREVNDVISQTKLTFANTAEDEHLYKSLSSENAIISSEKSQAESWHNSNYSQNSEMNVSAADSLIKITSLINTENEHRSDASTSNGEYSEDLKMDEKQNIDVTSTSSDIIKNDYQRISSSSSSSSSLDSQIENKNTGTSTSITISNNSIQDPSTLSSSIDSTAKSGIDSEYLNQFLRKENKAIINESRTSEMSTSSGTASNKIISDNRDEWLKTSSLLETPNASKEKKIHVVDTIQNILKPVVTIKASTESTISSSDELLQNNSLKESISSDTSKRAQENQGYFNVSKEEFKDSISETRMEIISNRMYEENRRDSTLLNALYEKKQMDDQLNDRNETSINNSTETSESTILNNKHEHLERKSSYEPQEYIGSIINSEKMKNQRDASNANGVASSRSVTSTSINDENKNNLVVKSLHNLHTEMPQNNKRRSDILWNVNENISNKSATYENERANSDVLNKIIFSSYHRDDEMLAKKNNNSDILKETVTTVGDKELKQNYLQKTVVSSGLQLESENIENVSQRYKKKPSDQYFKNEHQNNTITEFVTDIQDRNQREMSSSMNSNTQSKINLKSNISSENEVINTQTYASSQTASSSTSSSSHMESQTKNENMMERQMSGESISSSVNKNTYKSDLTQERSLFVPSKVAQKSKEYNYIEQKVNIEGTAGTRTSEEISNSNVSAIERRDDIQRETSGASQSQQRDLNVPTEHNTVISNVLMSTEGKSFSEMQNTQQELLGTFTISNTHAKQHETINNQEIAESQEKLTGNLSKLNLHTKSQVGNEIESSVSQDGRIIAESSAEASALFDSLQNIQQYESSEKNSLFDPAHTENEEKNIAESNATAVADAIASVKETNYDVIKDEQQSNVTKTTLFNSRAEEQKHQGYNSAVQRISTDTTSFRDIEDRLSENKNFLKKTSFTGVEGQRQGDSWETTSSVNSFVNAQIKSEPDSSVSEKRLVAAHSTESSNSEALVHTDRKNDLNELTATSPNDSRNFLNQGGNISQESSIEAELSETSSEVISESRVENARRTKILHDSCDNSATVVDSTAKTESIDRRVQHEDLRETASWSTRDSLNDIANGSTSSANSYVATQAASEDIAEDEKAKEDRGVNILTLGKAQVKGAHPSDWLVATSDAGALTEYAQNKDKLNVLQKVQEIDVYAETSADTVAPDNIEDGQRDIRVKDPSEYQDASNAATKIQDAAATSGVSVEMTSSREVKDESERASISDSRVTATSSSYEMNREARIKNEEESDISSSSEFFVNVGRKAEEQSSTTIHLPPVETTTLQPSRKTSKCDDSDQAREFISEITSLNQMLSKQQDSEILLLKKNPEGPVQVASLKNSVPPLVNYRLIPREVYKKIRTIITTKQILCMSCPLVNI